MTTTYKVIIKNDTGDANTSRVYVVYSEFPGVSGGGIASALRTQWAKSKGLVNQGQDVFRYTSESFGFAGYCNASTSSSMTSGTEITLVASNSVTIGSFRNDGSSLYVSENNDAIGIKDTGSSTSNNGTFTISTDARIPSPSTYVVGLARKSERDGISPVAVVECKPGADFVFTPSPAIYIARGNQGDGVILSSIGTYGRVEFRGNSKEAIVSETANGTFSVVYK